ncbi:MAG: hypothetical protein NC100_10825, partial [Clostridium sp.]|nr:hypothetical protein [Clostridium sp.]
RPLDPKSSALAKLSHTPFFHENSFALLFSFTALLSTQVLLYRMVLEKSTPYFYIFAYCGNSATHFQKNGLLIQTANP